MELWWRLCRRERHNRIERNWNHAGRPCSIGQLASWRHDGKCVNRYEAEQAARIAQLETDVKLRDAELYSNNKYLEVYTALNNEIQGLKQQLCDQAVTNQKTADSFALAAADLAAVKSELKKDIAIESEKRCCGDNSIVNYANATFYPKMVADVTTGSTTTAQNTYNPIPSCGTMCACN